MYANSMILELIFAKSLLYPVFSTPRRGTLSGGTVTLCTI